MYISPAAVVHGAPIFAPMENASATEIPTGAQPPARILRHGVEVGAVVAATPPLVRRTIPVYALGHREPVGFVRHALYFLTLPFQLAPADAYVFESGLGAWPIDAHALSADDGWHWTYGCWSRLPDDMPAPTNS